MDFLDYIEYCINANEIIDEPKVNIGIIYIINCKCKKNNVYIGQTTQINLKKRLKQHIFNNNTNVKLLCHCKLQINELIKVKFYDKNSLNKLEKYYINLYKNDINYNVVNK